VGVGSAPSVRGLVGEPPAGVFIANVKGFGMVMTVWGGLQDDCYDFGGAACVYLGAGGVLVGGATDAGGVWDFGGVCSTDEGSGCQSGALNGFLAAGLVWALWLGEEGRGVALFFLACVLVAGIYGAATASRPILFVQALGIVAVLLRV
jgi:hypothetical protein